MSAFSLKADDFLFKSVVIAAVRGSAYGQKLSYNVRSEHMSSLLYLPSMIYPLLCGKTYGGCTSNGGRRCLGENRFFIFLL